MNFQLLKLIVWSKSTEHSPRIVEFKEGVLNVITGASRTGKSAIIPIIDYCLASSKCSIPIDTIRTYAAWYGVIFQTETEQILICREVPKGTKASNNFFITRGKSISIPFSITESNEKTDGIKNILNSIASVPFFSLDGNNGDYKARLSFRDLMSLIFQNQDIVANQNIFFYKTHAHEYRERLRNWFPYIIGAENLETLNARQELQKISQQLKQLEKELKSLEVVSATRVDNMRGDLSLAVEYGLLSQIPEESSAEKLIEVGNNILNNVPNFSKTTPEDVKKSNSDLIELEKKEYILSEKIGDIKKRLRDIDKLKTGLDDYGNSVRKRADRLNISQWLDDVSSGHDCCPACGSVEHPNTKNELAKISLAFKQYENDSNIIKDIPTAFDREQTALKSQLDDLIEEKNQFEKRFTFVISKNKEAQKEFQQRKNMFLFLGHLKAAIETLEALSEGGELKERKAKLEEKSNELKDKVDSKEIQRRIRAATLEISQGILEHLKTLDVEDKYRKIAPRFDIGNLNISVLSNDKNWHFLAEVGSASNWVSFHLALMCSLQEFFLSLKSSCVPSFVIFDQPSQVYFPKTKRGEKLKDDLPYESEDEEAVRAMFKTIAASISSNDGKWQGIILDHAGDNIYGELDNVHEVEVWRNGKKLIPEEWIDYDSDKIQSTFL